MGRGTIWLGGAVLVAAAVAAGAGWTALVPRPDPQPLPAALVAADSDAGRDLLDGAEARADHPALAREFEPQWLNSYCGVASGVAVLGALGVQVTQQRYFSDAAAEVRPRWRVALTGMTLDALGGLLEAHGAAVSVHYADNFDAGDFREVVVRNLAQPGDYLIVNYQRQSLGQVGGGHISPLAAYDADSDMVLVMDTAANRYPQSWVPLEALVVAMATVDSETQAMRGYVEVAGLAGR
jgi:hypothetical protein